jgi:hypothetical protein
MSQGGGKMKKLTALLLGLLVIGGMAGFVNAAFSGLVLHVHNDPGTYYLENKTVKWDAAQIIGSVSNFSVKYDALIKNFTSSENSPQCVAIMEILVNRGTKIEGTYGFYQCSDNPTIVIKGTGQNNITTGVYANVTSHTFEIVALNDSNTWKIEFLVDGKSEGNYTGLSISSIDEVHAGTGSAGPGYDLYIDNVHEEIDFINSATKITADENFDDGKDEYFTDDKSGGGTETVADASKVPFFSGTATEGVLVTLLIAGVLWLFKKR